MSQTWLCARAQLANRAERPPFVETVRQEQDPHASGNVGAVSGYGPYFGSVPDFANEGQGVKFAEVRAGSPAAKAGLRGGDVMIAFAGLPIKTLYDFTFALREKTPGVASGLCYATEEVKVTWNYHSP